MADPIGVANQGAPVNRDPGDTAMGTNQGSQIKPTPQPVSASASGSGSEYSPRPSESGSLSSVPSSSLPIMAQEIKNLKGYLYLLLFNDNGTLKINIIFVASTVLPGNLQELSNVMNSKDDKYVVGKNGSGFDFYHHPTLQDKTSFPTINVGSPPQPGNTSTDFNALEPVDAHTFVLKHLPRLIELSNHLFTGDNAYEIDGWSLNLEVKKDKTFTIIDISDDKNPKVMVSGKATTSGGGRGKKRTVGTLACVAITKAKRVPLKKLGLMPTPDGKVRMVYRMGRLNVVRMRPPWCSKIVPVPVRDLKYINTGVRRR